MIFDVSHRTAYAYRKPVLQSEHLVHLAPREGPRQSVLRHSLLIEPAPSAKIERQDYFGNGTAILTVDDEHSELVIHARSTVEVRAPDLPILALSAPWEQVPSRALRSKRRARHRRAPVRQRVAAHARRRRGARLRPPVVSSAPADPGRRRWT